MLPFKLPDFYMPYPARVNPHLGGARESSKGWARTVGILGTDGVATGEVVWSEQKFDAMDFALFTAHTHPDTPSVELELLTEWYIWGWYVDDFVAKVYEQSRDLGAAKEFLSRLPAFMPKDLTDAVPEPANAMERALVDLWPRTAPVMSSAWRQRYVEHIVTMADAGLRSILIATLGEPEDLDPLEYVALRRVTSGMMWSAALVERSLAAEVPAHLHEARAIRVLNDCFCDSVALRNDIISYHLDVEEGKTANAVMVVREFLECEIQRAADVVNDLVSSRMFQFENTLAVELALLFEEQPQDPVTLACVQRYTRGLQDWMGGDFKWETRPGGRYLPAEPKGSGAEGGPGEAATTIAPSIQPGLRHLVPSLRRFKSNSHVPHREVTVTIPPVYMPYAVKVSPHVDEARVFNTRWFREVGILEPEPSDAGVLWDRQVLESYDFAGLAARYLPDASAAQVRLGMLWFAWSNWADDYCMVFFIRDYDAVRVQVRRLSLFMPVDGEAMPVPTNLLESSLLELWKTSAELGPPDWLRALRTAIQGWMAAWLWESLNLAQHRIPDPIDYAEMRRWSFGADAMLVLSRTQLVGKVPAEVLESETMRALERMAASFVGFTNDIVTYLKEIQFDGDFHNMVLILESFLDVDLDEAVLAVNELMRQKVRQFEHILATELPYLLDAFQLDDEARGLIRGHVEGMERMMSSVLDWYMFSGRSDQNEIRRNCVSVRVARGTRSNEVPAAPHRPAPQKTSATRLDFGRDRSDPAPSLQPESSLVPRTTLGTSPAVLEALRGAMSAAPPPQRVEPATLSFSTRPTGLGTSTLRFDDIYAGQGG